MTSTTARSDVSATGILARILVVGGLLIAAKTGLLVSMSTAVAQFITERAAIGS